MTSTEYDHRPPTIQDQARAAGSVIKLYAKAIGFFVLSLIITGSLLNIVHPYMAEGAWTGLFIGGLAGVCLISIMYTRSLGLG